MTAQILSIQDFITDHMYPDANSFINFKFESCLYIETYLRKVQINKRKKLI